MKRYNRLTTTQVVNGRNIKTITSKGKVTIQDLIDRLYELEDKIENGILVLKYSVVESGNTYCACMVDTSKLLVIDEYETKAEAEKRLEEIRNETKSIDSSGK